MRAAVYLRISSDREGDEEGVDRQRDQCLALAKTRGWPNPREFMDNDISATSGKPRPAFEALMTEVRAGTIDRIIVGHTSRFWRNRIERAAGIEELRVARVSLVAVKGPELDMTHAAGRGMAALLGEFDTMESEITRERVKAAAKQRAERGKHHGGSRAFGYTADGMSLVDGEAADLKRWYAELLAGRSISAIAAEAGKHHASMRAIFANPRNASLRVLDGVEYPSPWPAIVPEATWRAAVALLRDPERRVNHSGGRRKWLGSGLYGCERCDGRKVGIAYNGAANGGRALYRCIPATGGCGRVWRAVELDEYVTYVVEQRLRRGDLAQLLPRHRPDLDALYAERAALKERQKQVGTLWGRGEMGDDERDAASRSIRERLAEIDASLGESQPDGALARLLTFDNPAQAWLDTPVGEVEIRQGIVRALMAVTLGPSPRGFQKWDPLVFVRITDPVR